MVATHSSNPSTVNELKLTGNVSNTLTEFSIICFHVSLKSSSLIVHCTRRDKVALNLFRFNLGLSLLLCLIIIVKWKSWRCQRQRDSIFNIKSFLLYLWDFSSLWNGNLCHKSLKLYAVKSLTNGISKETKSLIELLTANFTGRKKGLRTRGLWICLNSLCTGQWFLKDWR